jgi:hypothetical protein
MSQSLSRLYIHATFHIKYSSVPIRKQEYTELYAYIGIWRGIMRRISSLIKLPLDSVESSISGRNRNSLLSRRVPLRSARRYR